MKVTRDIPEQLILEDTPWLAGIMIGALTLVFTGIAIASVMSGEPGGLVALVGTALGALAFWAFVRRTMVIFDRGNGTLDIRQRWVNGQTREVFRLEDVVRAHVETSVSRSEGRTSRTHRLALEMAPGHNPARVLPTTVYSGGKGAERAALIVNDWLERG